MPHTIAFDGNVIRLSFTGFITRQEIQDAAAELTTLESQFTRMPDRLTDLSGIVDRESDFETIFAVADAIQRKVYPNSFRAAAVAPNPTAYGMARSFQTLSSNPQVEFKIFATVPDAEAWLRPAASA